MEFLCLFEKYRKLKTKCNRQYNYIKTILNNNYYITRDNQMLRSENIKIKKENRRLKKELRNEKSNRI